MQDAQTNPVDTIFIKEESKLIDARMAMLDGSRFDQVMMNTPDLMMSTLADW